MQVVYLLYLCAALLKQLFGQCMVTLFCIAHIMCNIHNVHVLAYQLFFIQCITTQSSS